MISVNTFLATLFPPELLAPDEVPLVSWPAEFTDRDSGELKAFYAQRAWSRRNRIPDDRPTFFCVSTVERQQRRQIKRRYENVRNAMALVVDDVGTKSDPPPVPPSYILESSEGNYQWGYLLEPYDVSTPAGQAYYDSVLFSLAKAGFNDPGCRGATRIMRLPGAVHKTGFIARIDEWHPNRVWELDDLVTEFDIPLIAPKTRKALKPGKYQRLEDVDDGIYEWLIAQGRVLGHNEQWVFIECPWRHEHTDGAQGASSTAYSPDEYGREGRTFKCLHGHCAHRNTADFLTWVQQTINGDQS